LQFTNIAIYFFPINLAFDNNKTSSKD